MTVLAGALLGLIGSGHCMAMCGPLILAVGTPCRDQRPAIRIAAVGSYHLGRIGTYALLGVVAGAAGSLMGLAGMGRALAVGGGVLLLVAGLGSGFVRRWPSWTGPWFGVAAHAGAAARAWQATHPISGPFAAGLANGLLPCGMVYAALATSLAAGTIGQAVLTMAAFGAGTAPALAGLSLSASHLSINWRRRLSRAAPIGLAVVGVMLIVRGLAPAHATKTPSSGPAQTAPAHLH